MGDNAEVLKQTLAAGIGMVLERIIFIFIQLFYSIYYLDFAGGNRYNVLVPNMKGFEEAVAAGATEISIFGAASETFSKKNINCTIDESLERFKPIAEAARARNVRVRGYVSTALGCPYEGPTDPERVTAVAERLFFDLGCYEVSIGDTIGTGTPGSTDRLFRSLTRKIPPHNLALHFHDTYGQALANIVVGLLHGVDTIDSSVAGCGGCPYAKGASGNVATEDVLYMLKDLGVQCDVPLAGAIEAGDFISEVLGKPNSSKAAKAVKASCEKIVPGGG